MTLNASERIDEYVESMNDWRGEMLGRLRRTINEADPDLVEEWKWNSAAWSKDGLVCVLVAFKNYVKVNFFKGAMLDDPRGLINAGQESKTQRGIDLFEGDDIDEQALQELVRAAADFNSQ